MTAARRRTGGGSGRTGGAAKGHNLLLVGVGGQGILLAGRVLCQAAMEQGYTVNCFESHGMAQRGGAVVNHIRWGAGISSSLIMEGASDMLVALEPVEALRRLELLSPHTTAVINTKPIPPITLSSDPGARYPTTKQVVRTLESHVGTVVPVDGTELAVAAGTPVLLSTVMIGAAWGTGRLPLKKKLLLGAVEELVPPRYLEQNLAAFEAGRRAARSV